MRIMIVPLPPRSLRCESGAILRSSSVSVKQDAECPHCGMTPFGASVVCM